MSRIRSIKPEFWTDEKIVQLPYAARLLFIGMWNFCDDEGFLEDQPDRLRLQILPNDDIDAELYIDLLFAAGLVERLLLSDGRDILRIPNFSRHQKISHITKTRFPIASAKKKVISFETRRNAAIKYGCKPGEIKEVECHFCGAKGSIWWDRMRSGRPSAWVAYSGVEIDRFIPEISGGNENDKNIVISCRYCNRSRGSGDAVEFVMEVVEKIPENSGTLRPEGKGIDHGREGKGKHSRRSEPNGASKPSAIFGFDEFYAAYPKKVDPKDARSKFASAIKFGVDPNHIIEAAKRWAEAWRLAGTDKQYISAPAVWLNKGSYDSEDLPRAKPREQERESPFPPGVMWSRD